MMVKEFSLEPFPLNNPLPFLNRLKITGKIGRCSNTLSVSYALIGPLAEIVIPAPADIHVRKNGLWEETCFEFFVASKDSAQYWEFNLSPAGHWNVYSFKSYRQDMREEPAFMSLPFGVSRQVDAFGLSLKLDLDRIIPADRILKAAASAVIKSIDDKITYWALTHPGPQADFHRRDSFIIELDT
jgi:hypothetical protein